MDVKWCPIGQILQIGSFICDIIRNDFSDVQFSPFCKLKIEL